ncbi:MAG TPA: hypothetical protein DCY12_06720 [Candidatus Atribacteria bacterium]|nr:hypothetical protein [Candidatus Atribacteria bacterium]
MKRFEKIKIIFLTTLLLIGCNFSKQQPRCSDETVQATVIKIAKEKMLEKLQEVKDTVPSPDFVKDFEAKWLDGMEHLKLDAIRTRSVDKERCQCECAADLLIDPEQPTPITYVVEKADNGELYVTVYGL